MEEIFSKVTNTSVSVGNTSTKVLSFNGKRGWAIFVNDSEETIYLALGGEAVLNKGIKLPKDGQFELASHNNFKGEVFAISTSGGKNLCVSWGE